MAAQPLRQIRISMAPSPNFPLLTRMPARSRVAPSVSGRSRENPPCIQLGRIAGRRPANSNVGTKLPASRAQVRTSNGITGWVLAQDNFDGMDILGTTFPTTGGRVLNQLALRRQNQSPYRVPLRLASRAVSNSSPFSQPTNLDWAAASHPNTNPNRAIAASPVKSMLG
jgi:hypothetical protein